MNIRNGTLAALAIAISSNVLAVDGTEKIVFEYKMPRPTEIEASSHSVKAPIKEESTATGLRFFGTPGDARGYPSYPGLTYYYPNLISGEILDGFQSTGKGYIARVLVSGRFAGPHGFKVSPNSYRDLFFIGIKGDCNFHYPDGTNPYEWGGGDNLYSEFRQDISKPDVQPFSYFTDTVLKINTDDVNCTDPAGDTNGFNFYAYITGPTLEIDQVTLQIFEKN